MFGRADRVSFDQVPASHGSTEGSEAVPNSDPTIVDPAIDPNTELARRFDRLSRYEATLWRHVGQILFALDALDRRKPQE